MTEIFMVLDSFGDLMVERRQLPESVLDTDIEGVRRNPVLADLFQRMSFMERRGSGLRKICHETMAKDNYEDRFLPRFEDKNGFFRVILWDMNYRESDKTDQVTDQVITWSGRHSGCAQAPRWPHRTAPGRPAPDGAPR